MELYESLTASLETKVKGEGKHEIYEHVIENLHIQLTEAQKGKGKKQRGNIGFECQNITIIWTFVYTL